jgi:transcription initiation factor TFIIF subunit beta
LQQKLFRLFGEHEYYGLNDLAEMTNEPKTYLTEILEQIADYEASGVHRNKWV